MAIPAAAGTQSQLYQNSFDIVCAVKVGRFGNRLTQNFYVS